MLKCPICDTNYTTYCTTCVDMFKRKYNTRNSVRVCTSHAISLWEWSLINYYYGGVKKCEK